MLLTNIIFISSLVNNNIDHNKFYKNNLIIISENTNIYKKVDVNKIGIVDFRMILRNSDAMKNLSKEFISSEKILNKKLSIKKKLLKEKEKKVLALKNKIPIEDYNNKLKEFKEYVFIVQKTDNENRLILNKLFQSIQKKIKDLLAKVIKEISIKKKINIVILKENIFIFNDDSIDITLEVLKVFNKSIQNISIKSSLSIEFVK
ncbi:MAG: OmpH family outer membrane protein [Candidatus Puniceispirillales bacterium]|tara:strand:+ start:782 stop:1393 length:612 start_codon:yes stop_codon:yes gene_type:complete